MAIFVEGLFAEGLFAEGLFEGLSSNVTPTIPEAQINIAGNQVTFFSFNNLTFGADGNTGFALSLSGGSVGLSYVSGDGTTELVYALDRYVRSDETGTYGYTQAGDGVKDATSSLVLATFSGQAITNNSAYVLPALLSASIREDELILTFNKALAVGAGGNGGVALTASGGGLTATFVSAGVSATYSLDRTPDVDETITVAYTQPGDGLEDSVGEDLASFSGITVLLNDQRHTRTSLVHKATGFQHNDATNRHNRFALAHNS